MKQSPVAAKMFKIVTAYRGRLACRERESASNTSIIVFNRTSAPDGT